MPNDTTYTLDDFVESVIKEKNFSTLTSAMHEELKKDLLDRVQDFLIARTIAKLSDDKAKELSVLLDTNPDDKQLQDFIAGSIPDAPTFIGDTLFAFRQTYLGLV
jgi:hypothetical protein